MKAAASALVFIFLLAAGLSFASPAGEAKWETYEAAFARAAKEGRFVIVDFYTSWCRDCKEMDRTTFTNPDIVRRLSGFEAAKVDAERRADLSSKYGIIGYPTIIMLDKTGKVLAQRVGYMQKEELAAMMDYALTGAYKNTSYPMYLKSRK
jgi:uncharacterized protein